MRRGVALTTLALLVPAASAAAAPLSITVERKADRSCTANVALRIASGACQTKDLAVKIPAGTVSVKLQVVKAAGCPVLPVLVRTSGSGPARGSFTALEAAPGASVTKNLTRNLSTTAPEEFVSPGGAHKLHVEVPYRECSSLKAFRVKLTFAKIAAPKKR